MDQQIYVYNWFDTEPSLRNWHLQFRETNVGCGRESLWSAGQSCLLFRVLEINDCPGSSHFIVVMAESIVTFQSQLSGVMETVFKAAMYEITRLVEDSFLEEVTRCREQVESLKRRLKWSENRRKEREGDRRGRCIDCGRVGVSSEEKSRATGECVWCYSSIFSQYSLCHVGD